MTWYKILIGAAIVGTAAWYLKTKKPFQKISFENFKKECIAEGELLVATPECNKAIIVLKRNNDVVLPFIYRRFNDGKVTKKQLAVEPFPLELCPNEVQQSNEEYVLYTLK